MAIETDGIAIVFEDPAVLVQRSNTSPNHKSRIRRNHTKSRNGCHTCRQRRIKCNEGRPECLYCWQKGVSCHYSPSSNPDTAQTTTTHVQQTPTDDNVYFTSLQRSKALQSLEREHITCLIVKDPLYRFSDALYLLDYFVSTRDKTWIASSACQSIMQNHAFQLGLESPYLLHAILAFSAAYHSYQDPENKKWSIAAILHYHKSLSHYQQHFEGNIEEDDADAMMACAVLLSVVAFVHTTSQPDEESNGLAWVRSMQGTQVLSQNPTLRHGLSRGAWAPLVQRFDDWRSNIFGTYLDLSPRSSEDLEQIRALGHLCAKHAPLERQQLYKTPLFMLEYLAQLPPNLEIGNRFVYFISILSNDFIKLLDAEDHFAMLMMAFWCAFLSRIDQWWISISAGCECRRICTVILQRGDTQLHEILQYLLSLQSVASAT